MPAEKPNTSTLALGKLTPESAPCPLLATNYGLSERPRDEMDQGLVADVPVAHALLEESRLGSAPPRGSAPILDRGGTYLRCCVFLI